jgi:DNA-binding NarL/FixJ family response regulator
LDDHTIFRQGLARLLNSEPDMELKLAFGTVGEALIVVAAGLVDVVVLDVDLGPERGIDFLAQARANGFRGPVLLLTAGLSHNEEELMRQHGISAILTKDGSAQSLAAHIREATGLPPPTPTVSADAPEVLRFTSNEREVLRLAVEGLLNKEIAEELGCTESAVKARLRQLFHKTGARTRSQLVHIALEKYREYI